MADTFNVCYAANLQVGWTSNKKDFRNLFNENVFDSLKKIKAVYSRDYKNIYDPLLATVPLPKEVPALLKRLRHTYRLVIISSAVTASVKYFLNKYHINKYFSDVLGAQTHTSKREKIKFILKKYGISSHDAVFITDTLGDVLEARISNIGTIAIAGGFHSISTLKKGKPDLLVKNQKKFTGSSQCIF